MDGKSSRMLLLALTKMDNDLPFSSCGRNMKHDDKLFFLFSWTWRFGGVDSNAVFFGNDTLNCDVLVVCLQSVPAQGFISSASGFLAKSFCRGR